MSSTNKTTNYELSQFVSTDKPAWLTDYNQDMGKIDTGIKSAADTATGADGKADANTTKIGDLSYLSTTAKNNLVAAVNEVDGNADTATGVANQAMGKANANEQAIAGLGTEIEKFNLVDFRTPAVTGSGMNITLNELKTAVNADGSLGKIYGTLFCTVTGSAANFTIADTGFRPEQDINVDGICIRQDTSSGTGYLNVLPITIKTDGTIKLQYNFTSTWNGRTVSLIFPACVIFAKNFGD